MGAPAVAAYLGMLAEIQRISAADLARAAGVQSKYLWRMERGEIEQPGMQTILRMVQHVRGSLDDVQTLLMGDSEPPAGRVVALAWAVRQGWMTREHADLFRTASQEELRAAAEYLRRLADE
mgnify:CR=1 FL=1